MTILYALISNNIDEQTLFFDDKYNLLSNCKVNKLTSDSEGKVVTYTSFYVFLAKMVGKHAKIRGFRVYFVYLSEQSDKFSIKLSIFANNSAKEPQTTTIIMQFTGMVRQQKLHKYFN